MTDNEIIKALECCILSKQICPKNCPLANDRGCMVKVKENALDIINRQKAEIERLKIKIEGVQEANAILREHIRKAIKEFAERLKEKAEKHDCTYYMSGYRITAVDVKDIDSLVKEMVGEQE